MLANFILGEGGFNSRMMREIRSNRGLAYSVGSFYRGDIGYGVFVSWCKTRNQTAPEVLGLMTGLMEEMRRGEITEEELSWAREAIINGMIFRYSSTSTLLSEAMRLEYDGLPPDYIRELKKKIQEATLDSVREVARKHLDPDGATVVILGNGSEYEGPWPGERALNSLEVTPEGEIRQLP